MQAILNEKVSEATGLKPNEIVFVGKVDLHAGRLYPRPTAKERKSTSEFMREQLDLQDYLLTEMEKNQEETNAKHLEKQEARHKTPTLEIGTYVVARYEDEDDDEMAWTISHHKGARETSRKSIHDIQCEEAIREELP